MRIMKVCLMLLITVFSFTWCANASDTVKHGSQKKFHHGIIAGAASDAWFVGKTVSYPARHPKKTKHAVTAAAKKAGKVAAVPIVLAAQI